MMAAVLAIWLLLVFLGRVEQDRFPATGGDLELELSASDEARDFVSTDVSEGELRGDAVDPDGLSAKCCCYTESLSNLAVSFFYIYLSPDTAGVFP